VLRKVGTIVPTLRSTREQTPPTSRPQAAGRGDLQDLPTEIERHAREAMERRQRDNRKRQPPMPHPVHLAELDYAQPDEHLGNQERENDDPKHHQGSKRNRQAEEHAGSLRRGDLHTPYPQVGLSASKRDVGLPADGARLGQRQPDGEGSASAASPRDADRALVTLDDFLGDSEANP